MIRLKAYIKWLSERGYLDQLHASDVPINNIILQEPVYLTKEEMTKVFEYLEDRVRKVQKKKKRDHRYWAYL